MRPGFCISIVMAGLDPAIHDVPAGDVGRAPEGPCPIGDLRDMPVRVDAEVKPPQPFHVLTHAEPLAAPPWHHGVGAIDCQCGCVAG